MTPYKITYDAEAQALYLYLRDAKVERTEPRGEVIFVDFDTVGAVGIEILDVDAHLSRIIHEFGLDPHLLTVLEKIRQLIPEATKELVLA